MSDVKTGPARERVDISELTKAMSTRTIVTDDRRRRPLWFDGRFLDAQALNSEQNYFLARQNDFGRVAGFGVVTGLNVMVHPSKARTLTIQAGHGLTPAGNQVVLSEPLIVDLAAVAETQRLDSSFGLSAIPKASPINRTGMFIIALRTVEYTGNPISAYPTHIDAARTVHDGSVIEATAVTLVPYPDVGAGSELEQRRKQVVREIFFEESKKGQPEDVLPLAMLALDHGVIKWLDVFMVRREIGLRERKVWGLGLSSRPLRAAQLRQYDVHLQELQSRLGVSSRIIASEHFSVLPPAGPLPVSGVNGSDFSQSFFPAEVDVELSLIPEDELAALIEDAMLLPPLDLTISGEAQESTSVLVVMPVARHLFRGLSQRLPTLTRALSAAQPGMLSKRKPITALNQLMSRRVLPVDLPPILTADSVWRTELSKQNQLWYLRRRNLHYKADVTAWGVDMRSDEAATDALVAVRVDSLDMKTRFNALLSRGTRAGNAEMTAFMASPLMRNGSSTVIKAAVAELEKAPTLDSTAVMKVAERFSQPAFGEGLARIESSTSIAGNAQVVENLASSGLLPELDRLTRILPAEELNILSADLATAAGSNDAAALERVTKVIADKAAATRIPANTAVVTRPALSGIKVTPGITRG